MRLLAVFAIGLGLLLVGAVLPSGVTLAASIPVGGPNPNWTDMQKYEWYIGRMAAAAQMCGAYDEAGVLNRLARMSPYGGIGLGQMRGDDFYGPACVEIAADAKDIVADASKIEEYLEATYGCEGEGCYGLYLRDSWTDHECADALKAHLAHRAIALEGLREVSLYGTRLMSGVPEYQARVRFMTCEGALYVDLKDSCVVKKDYTRGDCEVAGVSGY
jgi:hypothetical protein